MVIGVFGGFKGVVGFLLSGSLVLGWVFILSGSLVLGWKVCNPTLSKLKVFEEPILNKIVEASVERLFSRHKQIHSPLRASLGNELVTDCLLVRISRQYIEAQTTNNTDMILPLYEDY